MKLKFDELTERELVVALALAKRKSRFEIAQQLSVSPHTIKTHAQNIYEKLDCTRKNLFPHVNEIQSWVEAKNTELGTLSVNSISGTWLSRFSYITRDPVDDSKIQGIQFNIEVLEKAVTHGPFSIQGWSMYGAANRETLYKHEIMCDLVGSSLVGVWTNTNSLNRGCFQLSIHSTERTMKGKHLGISSMNTIEVGHWFWLKILDDIVDEKRTIVPFEEINKIFEKWKKFQSKLDLSDFFR